MAPNCLMAEPCPPAPASQGLLGGELRLPSPRGRADAIISDRDACTRRQDLAAQEFQRLRHHGIGLPADIHLRQVAVVTEQLVLPGDLVDDLLRAADEERAIGTGPLV